LPVPRQSIVAIAFKKGFP